MHTVNWGKVARRAAIGALAVGGVALVFPWARAAVQAIVAQALVSTGTGGCRDNGRIGGGACD